MTSWAFLVIRDNSVIENIDLYTNDEIAVFPPVSGG